MHDVEMINRLCEVLPYPRKWYFTLNVRVVKAMYHKHVKGDYDSKKSNRKRPYTRQDVEYSIWKDEQEVRKRAGLI